MRRYIEHLRNKQHHEKRDFAVYGASAITAVIFLIWASTFGLRIASSGAPTTTVADTNASTLVAATAAASSAFQNQFSSMTSVTSVDSGSAPVGGSASAPQSAYGSAEPASPDNGSVTVIGSPGDPATAITQ